MLVLSRNVGQEITVGDDVVIRVTRVQGGRVQIGIEAPKSIQIRRERPAHAVTNDGCLSSGMVHSATLQ